jgi:general stress protein 26
MQACFVRLNKIRVTNGTEGNMPRMNRDHAAGNQSGTETDKPLDDLLEPGSTLMVGTTEADGLQFRPLTVARARGGRVEILLDTSESWAGALRDGDAVSVTMSDNRTNTWLWFRGTASTLTDPQLIDELWNPMAAAYFDDGRDTPGIAVLVIDADEGRYWTTPSGRVGSLISMIKAKVTGPDASGDHGDIAV